MSVEVGVLVDRVALVAVFILVAVLALLDQVVVQGRYFDNLFALPAGGQHRALFPVMDVDRLFVKVFVVKAAEVAGFILQLLLLTVVLLVHCSGACPSSSILTIVLVWTQSLLFVLLLISWSLVVWRLRLCLVAFVCSALSSTGIDIGRNHFFALWSGSLGVEVSTSNLC